MSMGIVTGKLTHLFARSQTCRYQKTTQGLVRGGPDMQLNLGKLTFNWEYTYLYLYITFSGHNVVQKYKGSLLFCLHNSTALKKNDVCLLFSWIGFHICFDVRQFCLNLSTSKYFYKAVKNYYEAVIFTSNLPHMIWPIDPSKDVQRIIL